MKKIHLFNNSRYKDHKNETNSTPNLWIINENLFVAPLLSVLEEIRLFVTLSKEVVVVNFVNFPIGTKLSVIH